jgi:hypothetical protein
MWAILRSGQGRWSTDMQRHRFVSALSEARFHKSVKSRRIVTVGKVSTGGQPVLRITSRVKSSTCFAPAWKSRWSERHSEISFEGVVPVTLRHAV